MSRDSIIPEQVFSVLPEKLRRQLIAEFSRMCNHYICGDYMPAEIDGGRFCEAVYSIIEGYFKGKYPESATKPENIVDSCRRIENYPNVSNTPRSFRIAIPRLLAVLYDIRNNRNVGHISDDIDPNFMDSTFVVKSASWIMAELIRVFHSVDMEHVQDLIDELLCFGDIPVIWAVGDRRRVMSTKFTYIEQVLLILARQRTSTVPSLLLDIEYKDKGHFKSRVIMNGHNRRLWEYDEIKNEVTISPLGIQEVKKVFRRVRA